MLITIDKKISNLSMSDYETLRETKVAYNYIKDILENSETRMDNITTSELYNSLDALKDLYRVVYINLENDKNRKEQLITDACCKNCSCKLLVSDNIDYSYQCEECDENFYDFEVISNGCWYKDEKKEHKTLPSSFNLQITFNKEKDELYISNESRSGVIYSCTNVDELLKNIEMYSNEYLNEKEEKLEY